MAEIINHYSKNPDIFPELANSSFSDNLNPAVTERALHKLEAGLVYSPPEYIRDCFAHMTKTVYMVDSVELHLRTGLFAMLQKFWDLLWENWVIQKFSSHEYPEKFNSKAVRDYWTINSRNFTAMCDEISREVGIAYTPYAVASFLVMSDHPINKYQNGKMKNAPQQVIERLSLWEKSQDKEFVNSKQRELEELWETIRG